MSAPVVNQAPASEPATPGTPVPPFTSAAVKASMRISHFAFLCLTAAASTTSMAHHLQCAPAASPAQVPQEPPDAGPPATFRACLHDRDAWGTQMPHRLPPPPPERPELPRAAPPGASSERTRHLADTAPGRPPAETPAIPLHATQTAARRTAGARAPPVTATSPAISAPTSKGQLQGLGPGAVLRLMPVVAAAGPRSTAHPPPADPPAAPGPPPQPPTTPPSPFTAAPPELSVKHAIIHLMPIIAAACPRSPPPPHPIPADQQTALGTPPPPPVHAPVPVHTCTSSAKCETGRERQHPPAVLAYPSFAHRPPPSLWIDTPPPRPARTPTPAPVHA